MFPLNKNTLSLSFVALIVIGFFIAGLFDVLDYVIIKVLLIISSSVLALIAYIILIKSGSKKKRHEDTLQDDSY